MKNHPWKPTRREMLLGAAACAAGAWPGRRLAAASTEPLHLIAGPAKVSLNHGGTPDLNVWAYNGQVPGPEIRLRQGERLSAIVQNRLSEDTTVHWHGVRVPNAMDGVPHLTQCPIIAGSDFSYEFNVPDAGTFWYHPHDHSPDQVGRGLYGPLIVEEPEPIAVDRDVTWVLADWRLLENGQISDDFDGFMDIAHAGRIGNTVIINGVRPEPLDVRAGERIRLRLINAANARIFALQFQGHSPQIISYDGQPVEPHTPPSGLVLLGPAMRTDLILDMIGKPSERFAINDPFYQGLEYRLSEISYSDQPPLRERALGTPVRLSPNPLPEPAITQAVRHEILLQGGMMGGMAEAVVNDKMMPMRDMMHHGLAWAINGVSASEHVMQPSIVLKRNETAIFAVRNDTMWFHPMHIHGHSFRVITRNGQPNPLREWRDTVLIPPRESVELAFVANNPGDWMIHCHVLEHQAGGMMGVFRIE